MTALLDFTSDNTVGIADEVWAALGAARAGVAPSYGGDDWSAALNERFSRVFERDVSVFPLFTGTAANALAIAALTPSFGAVLAHEGAHIEGDECGAVEFFAGNKIVLLAGEAGRIDPAALTAALAALPAGLARKVQPSVLSLTQVTECGTLYRPEQIRQLTDIARGRGLKVHMDGARFANAVVSSGAAPADLTWRAGVDVLSFGATKNGGLAAEAVIFFDSALADGFQHRRHQAGQTASKMRFLSAQLLALLEDDVWLRLAGHANACAAQLAEGLAATGLAPLWPVEANEVFAALPPPLAAELKAQGVGFLVRGETGGRVIVRFVTSFQTQAEDVARLLQLVRQAG